MDRSTGDRDSGAACDLFWHWGSLARLRNQRVFRRAFRNYSLFPRHWPPAFAH